MRAVHFGAGNIGRGFIGVLLSQSGYEVTFVDINDALIQAINDEKKYEVIFASEDRSSQTVRHVNGINSMTHPEDVVDAIVKADLITTAIGPNILPKIAQILAKGLQARLTHTTEPLSIIACENMVGGSTFLKDHVYKYINEEEHQPFDHQYSFLNTAVDRIIPNQTNDNFLDVTVEPYFEWIVETKSNENQPLPINGAVFVDDLTPFIERKLFTVNTGHAVVAFYGYYLGLPTIAKAINDGRVMELVNGVLAETGEALIKKHLFHRSEHQSYIETIIKRFQNPFISDEVTRVARGSMRKLHKNDRFVQPALIYMEKTSKKPINIATIIAIVLRYRNDQDEESIKLQQMIHDIGYEKTLQQVTELEPGHPFIQLVLRQINEIEQ